MSRFPFANKMQIFSCLLLLFVGASHAFAPCSKSGLVTISPSSKRDGLTPLFLSTKTKTKDKKAAAEESSAFDYASQEQSPGGFSYVDFAKENPFVNNLLIATCKTAAADLLAQLVIAQTPISELDVQRSALFCLFGAIYLGAFQYAYQVQVRWVNS